MPQDYPGIAPAPLTKEPLGTQGELTPGPDELDPSIPEHHDELVTRGYLDADGDAVDDVDDVQGFEGFDDAPAPDIDPWDPDQPLLPELPQF